MSAAARSIEGGEGGEGIAEQGAAQQEAEQGKRPGKQGRQGQRNPALGDACGITEQEVQKFADAQGKVEQIKGQYQGKVKAAAEDPEKAMEVQREAQQEMVKAVKDTGLDVRKYNQIAQLAQYDTDLRERIQEKM